MRDKKAISPVITTVLLVMLVLIIATIILLWYKGVFSTEHILKFDKPAEQTCNDIAVKTYIDDLGNFSVTNIGNIAVYKIDLKLYPKDSGSSEIHTIENPGSAVLPVGGAYEFSDYESYDKYDKVYLIPIILGKDEDGNVKEYTCPKSSQILI